MTNTSSPLQQFSSPMHAHERGFLNMAMVHLQQQQRKFNHDFGGKIDMVSQSPRSMRADGSVGPDYTSALDDRWVTLHGVLESIFGRKQNLRRIPSS